MEFDNIVLFLFPYHYVSTVLNDFTAQKNIKGGGGGALYFVCLPVRRSVTVNSEIFARVLFSRNFAYKIS